MKFAKVLGDIDPAIVAKAQQRLSTVLVELAASPSNTSMATGLGGDPLVFSLMMSCEHHATLSIPTAGTNGKRYLWNPLWLAEQNYHTIRYTCYHESFHSEFNHPNRRGNRDEDIWNGCIDYVVMGMIFDCLKHWCRNAKYPRPESDAIELFRKGFTNYLTLDQFKFSLANPGKPIPGKEGWRPEPFDLAAEMKKLKIEDRAPTKEETEVLEQYAKRFKVYYADPNLPKDKRRPEIIYDELIAAMPEKPKSGSGKQDGEGGKKPGVVGDTLDYHEDCIEDPTKLAKRLADAIDMAKRMHGGVGSIPAGLEDHLGELMAPRITFQDDIRMTRAKVRDGNRHNDYTRFRSRPMSMGLLIPKRKDYTGKFVVLIDTSASVGEDDLVLGVSQLQSLDDRAEGIAVCCDTEVYWDRATKLTSMKPEALRKIAIVGRGGTALSGFFGDFEEKLGKQDFVVVITDGELMPGDFATMKDPGVPVFWLAVRGTFKVPFGKVYELQGEIE
jgi:predicted metal-dependent peptidase